jgi:hypothetical protein
MSIVLADILFDAMRKAVAAEIGAVGRRSAVFCGVRGNKWPSQRYPAVMTSYQSAGLCPASRLSL